jgi:hypothetical protein
VNPGPASRGQRPGGPVDVTRGAARQGGDRRLGDDLGDLPNGLSVGLRRNREASLDDVHPEGLELLGEPDLFLDSHRETGGLFAVAEGGVEDDQPFSHRPASLTGAMVKSQSYET